MKPFRKELEKHKTTKDALQIPYNKALPEDLVRRIAESRLRDVRALGLRFLRRFRLA